MINILIHHFADITAQLKHQYNKMMFQLLYFTTALLGFDEVATFVLTFAIVYLRNIGLQCVQKLHYEVVISISL